MSGALTVVDRDALREYIDSIPVIDTHSHQGMPSKPKHNLFDVGMYLHTDLVSAGMPEYPPEMQDRHDPDEYWEHTEPYLRFCRATSYYAQFINNYRTIHRHEGLELSRAQFLEYSDAMDARYHDYTEWLQTAYRDANIDLILSDRCWQPFRTDFDTRFFRYVFRVDELVLDAAEAAAGGRVCNPEALRLLGVDVREAGDLAAYLGYVDAVLDAVVAAGAVSLKVGLAYHRSIDFGLVDRADAERVYTAIGSKAAGSNAETVGSADLTALQDFLVRYLVERSVDLRLPVQVHTGYLHGNRGLLDRGHPMKLLPLVSALPEATFVLFHGGYPWIGECIAFAKNHPNVFLDLVWLPQLSRTAAIRGLHEALDAVPYNKLFWGSDVGYVDDAVGSLMLGREVVSTVLSERVERGWMSEDVARDVAVRVFRENAVDTFGLEKSRH
jgi:uncharacterized protein